MLKKQITCFWFRRDLRLDDNAGLYHALKNKFPVLPVFIFDKNILGKLEDKNDRRVVFIHHQLLKLNDELKKYGSTLLVKYSTPLNAWEEIISEYDVKDVFANHDYEPYAGERDKIMADYFASCKINFSTYKDQVIFEKDEVIKDDGTPYTVFTSYGKKWCAKLNAFYTKPYPTKKYVSNFYKIENKKFISLSEIGFTKSTEIFYDFSVDDETLKTYAANRDFPARNATSHVSVHLRFGTVSIRQLVVKAALLSDSWLNELIWREFYMMILWYFPNVHQAFKKKYDNIPWRNNEDEFYKWCSGQTGYPIVDAGMRELNATGFMHNRVRMITASFLTKHLLIDWRWGEAYFAKKLLDFELSSNNGGWQWAASSGCDAAPYFRIFNPAEQTKKFDPEFKYISKWVPEFQELNYPQPIVEHKFARERCLEVYKKALK